LPKDRSIWLERPSKISISGLIAAHFPEMGTVGGLRDVSGAGSISLPEDTVGLGDGRRVALSGGKSFFWES